MVAGVTEGKQYRYKQLFKKNLKRRQGIGAMSLKKRFLNNIDKKHQQRMKIPQKVQK